MARPGFMAIISEGANRLAESTADGHCYGCNADIENRKME